MMLEMPSRTIGLVGAVLVLYTRPALAQQPTAEAVQMQQMMVPMMSQMAAVMLESTLTTLAKPENAERLAELYQELLRRPTQARVHEGASVTTRRSHRNAASYGGRALTRGGLTCP